MDRGKIKKGQMAIQFILLISFIFLVYLVFVSFQSSMVKDQEDQYRNIVVKDMALKLGEEVNLASRMKDGYQREVVLPNYLDGFNYSINIAGTELIVSSGDESFSVSIPPINGSFVIGTNLICKQQNIICVNC